MAEKRKYDSTVARIAGNLLSGHPTADRVMVQAAVQTARWIVEEVERTQPAADLREAAEVR